MGEQITSGHQTSGTELLSFEDLFYRYSPRLKSYASYFLKNENEAEDLVQDVFYQLWKNRDQLNREKNIASFIFVQTRNRCLNSLKRKFVEEKFINQQVSLKSEELYHISFNDSGEFISMHEKLNDELKKLISVMPEKCGQAFELKWLEGKKIREIAEIMEISTTMVDKHLARGIEIARKEMNPDLFLFLLLTR